MKTAFKFLQLHWWHLILLIPGAIFITFLHEAAHAIAAIVQGGTILNFVILPSQGHWGYVEMAFPENQAYSDFAISIAPYVMWGVISCIGFILGKIRKWRFTLASIIFIWLFVIPLADIANALLPWMLFNSDNDLYYAFGTSNLAIALPITAIMIGLVYLLGFSFQKSIYQERSLSFAPYSLLFVVTILGVGILSCGL